MDKEVEAIGAHCQYTYCNQLDFLPFRCESCKGTYCLDHRTETAHKCPHAGAWAAARRKDAASSSASSATSPGKPTLLTATQCSHPACKTYINTLTNVGVGCTVCNRQYCLKHRLREDHSCAKLTPIGARPASILTSQAQNVEKARAAFSRLRAWGKEKQTAVLPKPKPSSSSSRLLALNQLKKSAKGDEKIPTEQRIYLHVEAEAATTTSAFPRGQFWYNKEWSVGRVLDAAAKGLQAQNVNNHGGGEEEKLRVFHVEGGRLLEFGEKVGVFHVEGGRLLEFGEKVGVGVGNGDTVVLLRGVGPAVPDLIRV
ncbi:an1 zinc finger protein [Lasallia pustulata]|uniref:An1 zinc finger protein n=1 Tax=Lasallia pustulata TaxID=136370 RepID=A0A1W5DCB2_9LECA|nr:an1 zinc finger protein [Lasallia pustulata]